MKINIIIIHHGVKKMTEEELYDYYYNFYLYNLNLYYRDIESKGKKVPDKITDIVKMYTAEAVKKALANNPELTNKKNHR